MSPSSSQSPPITSDPSDNPTSPVSSPPLHTSPFQPFSNSPAHSPSPQPTPSQNPTIATVPRPPFTPLFTFITDSKTSTAHHPSKIHYIFSDDDPALLTSACLAALSQPAPASASASPTSSTHQAIAPQPPSSKGRENRVLVLDMSPSGTEITAAHSLTSSWQILSTSLTAAPTWDSSPSPSEAEGQDTATGFMLRIEGTEGEIGSAAVGKVGKDGGEDLTSLVEEFEKRMAVLRTVVEAGGARGGEEAEPADGDGDAEGDGED